MHHHVLYLDSWVPFVVDVTDQTCAALKASQGDQHAADVARTIGVITRDIVERTASLRIAPHEEFQHYKLGASLNKLGVYKRSHPLNKV